MGTLISNCLRSCFPDTYKSFIKVAGAVRYEFNARLTAGSGTFGREGSALRRFGPGFGGRKIPEPLMRVAAVILTFNEAARVRDCLESVRWADEIVVVDGHSTDGTPDIAREYTDRVFLSDRLGPKNPGGYSNQSLWTEEGPSVCLGNVRSLIDCLPRVALGDVPPSEASHVLGLPEWMQVRLRINAWGK